MKNKGKTRILITGAGSYIGESVRTHLAKYPERYQVDVVDTMDGAWRKADFSAYDTVYHVAGFAHSDYGNSSKKIRSHYYEVNTDLAIAVAGQAKAAGVKQLIFMSSAIVYGDSGPIGKMKKITKETPMGAANFYGDSKVQAERGLTKMRDDSFKVVILRCPMIYGPGSKGNFPKLDAMARILPVFPMVKNARSMLYVENLAEFVRLMIDNEEDGVFWPCNKEWVNTSKLVHYIGKCNDSNIILLPGLDPFLKVLSHFTGLVDKAFGNLVYEKGLGDYKEEYRLYSTAESIRRTQMRVFSKRALMLASVASMIDLFNEDNIRILLDLGYDVDVACNFEEGSITSQERVDEYREELISRGIGVYRVPIPRSISKVKDIIESYQMVKEMVKNGKYDLVHCHSPIGAVICRLACRGARRHGTKVIYTAHGFHFFKGASKKAWMLYYPVERFLCRYTDILITINDEDYSNAKAFGIPRVEYVPGIGVHTADFQTVSVDRGEKRRELGLEDDDYVFLSVGQISRRKNHEVIIRALARIRDPKVKYVIVGFGEEEERLRKLVKRLKLTDRVIFAGFRQDVAELLGAVDAFAFPSTQEGLPVALMEAMAAGLPIVCSRIRGNTDLIEDGEGGFLCDYHDSEAFAAGMRRIAAGGGRDMGEINKNTMKRFDTKNVNRVMRRIYQTI